MERTDFEFALCCFIFLFLFFSSPFGEVRVGEPEKSVVKSRNAPRHVNVPKNNLPHVKNYFVSNKESIAYFIHFVKSGHILLILGKKCDFIVKIV
jgi:hypothetical protein